MSHYKHWKVETCINKIIWLGLDRQAESVNTINQEVLDELNSLIQDIEDKSDLTGVVIYSAKNKGFIAGADVHLFSQYKTVEPIGEFLRKGHVVFARLEALNLPTVAMIDGFCMGGGLELALACDYRVASDNPQTKLGLPEILLGFFPGWGGTVRLPRLVGGYNALTKLILTGRALAAKPAKAIGLVDEVVPLRQLKRAASYYATKSPAKHKLTFLQNLSNQSPVRMLIAALIRLQLKKRVAKEHYPAPYAVLDLWEQEGGLGDRAYLKEVEAVQRLITNGDTATNLIRSFLLRDRMKSFAKAAKFKAQKVHVIGAGTMGGDIAAWCSYCGIKVTIQDRNIESIAPMMQRAFKLYTKTLKKPWLIQAAMDRLIPDVEGVGVKDADVIIEAVFENLNVKREIFKQVEKSAKKDALIATNTSSIPLEKIAEVMQNPDRLVGIHFFNPVARMELVEVVKGAQTSKVVSDNACAFVNQIKKLPLPVKSSPGFLINRVLMPYLMAAVTLVEEGVKPYLVDQAATDFGMLMGPVELADTVGLDVCLAVAENLTSYYGGAVPHLLHEMVKAGSLGRKSGTGFYTYKNGKAIKKKSEKLEQAANLAERLINPLIDEAKKCLEEKVVADSDLLDGGMIFATGFAPFRGGPMQYDATRHKNSIKKKALETDYEGVVV
ncbi:MAG: crotonase [Legionellales bacterium RIFCSPHIGHO2_12_FULL_37_14]|nr:MAG: crotonase [Legionellales bacterium RIFCSPHIGHO2_12_FULL_37_14]